MHRTVAVITRCGECHDPFVLNFEREHQRADSASAVLQIGRSDICETCAIAFAERFKHWQPMTRVNW